MVKEQLGAGGDQISRGGIAGRACDPPSAEKVDALNDAQRPEEGE